MVFRDLVLPLLALWPSFEWQRLAYDPPPGWLDHSTEENSDLTQNRELRQAERTVSDWDHEKVAVPDTMHRMTECNLQLPPLLAPPSPVPVRPWIKPLSFVNLLRPEEEGGTFLSAEVIAAAPATATGATA